jgi:hypothetical protein
MSEHAWVEEHVAAYVVGGLGAQEAERLEAHVRDCPACAGLLAAARTLDGGVSSLFAGVRPGFALEDRVIARLRADSAPKPLFSHWGARVAAAAAAVLMLGTIGAFAGAMVDGSKLAMYDKAQKELASKGRVPIEPPRIDGFLGSLLYDTSGSMPAQDLTNEDLGLQSDLQAALPGVERVDKQTVDAAVTQDNLGRHDVIMGDGTVNSVTFGPDALSKLRGHGLASEMYSNRASQPASGGGNDSLWIDSSGRSGSTKERLLRYGGGNTPDTAVYGVWSASPATSYQTDLAGNTNGGSAPAGAVRPLYDPIAKPDTKNSSNPAVFTPSEYKLKVGKTVTRTEMTPPTVTVTQKEPAKQPDKAEPKPAAPEPQPVNPAPEPARRVILRSGDIEFEVPNFEAASAAVHKLVDGLKDKGAFVSTINSEKLPNGKVKGSITVRVPPEHLDGLVDSLKKQLGTTGELKGVKLASQDVTKQYYDLESRLRAARTMEERLLQIIKEGKGDIKVILEAEKERAVWRTKIEEFEGELRYFSNLAALSTLVIGITEKEIRAAAGLTEKERVQAGVEVEDVDAAYQQLLKAISEAKGRITKSEVKQVSAGQFNAAMQFEVAPDAGGPMRDRLRQLGRVARFEIDRVTETEGGTLPTDAKLKRGDTLFLVQLYNLANVTPRETQTLEVAAADVPAAYQALRDALAKTTGRVLNAQLNEQDRTNITAQLDFEVRRVDEPALRAALDAAGEVVSRQVTRAPESENVTDAKVLYKAALLSAARLKPREVTAVTVEVGDVDQTAAAFAAYVAEAKGRQADSQFTRERSGKVTAKLVFEVPLPAAAGLVERFKAAGVVRAYQSVKNLQASDGKFATARIEVTVTNREAIISDDASIWPQVRRGLAVSASVLLTSLTWVIFGLCVVLPWAVIAFVAYRLVRRRIRPATGTPTA